MERVLILGATSTIAAEVAVLHARRRDRLHLVGRNADKLSTVAVRCGGAEVSVERADLAVLDGAAAVIERARAALGGIDRVLIAHGELGDQLETERSYAAADHVLRVNLLSVVALLVPLANHLEEVGGGRLGVITSVAGERGRPRNYTYGAAKGALNIYLQGLRTRLYPRGVAVTTLKLGPVDTQMTEGHEKHALFGKPTTVAQGIVTAMDARTAEVYVPSFWRYIMTVVRSTPEPLFQRIPFLSGR